MNNSTNDNTDEKPTLVLNTQYIRHIEFDVPGAPGIYINHPAEPHVKFNFDVNANQIQNQPVFEVTLHMHCTALTAEPSEQTPQPESIFGVHIAYAGIFILQHIPQDQVEGYLLAEAPRFLFPAARNLLAQLTRDAGFAPVMVQPIDFFESWKAQKEHQAQMAQSQAAS